MTKRVLLTWEHGAGRTHAEHLKGTALELRAAGCECLFLHFNMLFAPEFAELGFRSMQAPVWPARLRTETPWPHRRASNIRDVVGNFGVAHPQVLRGVLDHYDTLFALWQPDLVIGEWGYGAGLAARGRLPFVAIGSSSSIAPLGPDGPPPFRPEGHVAIRPSPRESDPVDPLSEEEFLAGANSALVAAGRPPIEHSWDVLKATRRFCMTLPENDVYRGRRDEPALAPMLRGYRDDLVGGTGDEIFVYLHAFSQDNVALLAGLLSLDAQLRVYIPDILAENAEVLEDLGAIVESRPVPIADIVRRSRVVVHHGGGQLMALLLGAGIPQVMLMKELTNEASGTAVADLGVGRSIWHEEVTVPWLVDAIEDLASDEVRARAAELAPGYRALLRNQPAPIIARACLDLMGD